jgi:hypothetical protein
VFRHNLYQKCAFKKHFKMHFAFINFISSRLWDYNDFSSFRKILCVCVCAVNFKALELIKRKSSTDDK